MTSCRLDIFPMELVHKILSYFWTHEILQTFPDVSLYLDAVLLAYPCYRVNFKSIRRTDFDLVCQRILPDQIISLTLSDDEDTPGQVGLFLSRFRIEQFIHLRSLTIIDVGPDWWEPIVSKITQLKSLCSFFYVTPPRTARWISDLSDNKHTQLDKHLFDTYAPVLPQLSRLKLSHGDYFNSIPLPRLRYLILGQCSAQTLKHICCAAPQLESLDIKVQQLGSDAEFLYPFAHLNRLILNIKGTSVSINNMERFMKNLPRLKHLELKLDGNADLVDGQRWQTLTSGLFTFNFMFRALPELEMQDLDSFRTPFWLEEKRWFVAYVKLSLFSVPYFAKTMADEDFQPPINSTAPDNTIFYERVTALTLSKLPIDRDHCFTLVQTLNLGFAIPLSTLRKSVDLSRVQRLTLSSSAQNLVIEPLFNEMSSLYQISIAGCMKNFLQLARNKPIEKIRTLQFDHCSEDSDDCWIDELCRIFPCVEHLCIQHMHTAAKLFDFIDRLKDLSSASFHCFSVSISEEDKRNWRLLFRSALDRIRRVDNSIYAYRFDQSFVHIWI